MKFGRNTIWLIPLTLFLTFPLWSVPVTTFLSPRGQFDSEAQKSQTTSHNFDMESVKITQNQKGRNTAIIRAVRAETGKEPDTYFMDIVDADLINDEGEITQVTARKGEYNSVTKLLILKKDVVVNNLSEKQILYTELLHYDNLQRTIKCPGNMKIVGEDFQIEGGSLDYDIKTKTYDIGKRVHTVLYGFEAEP